VRVAEQILVVHAAVHPTGAGVDAAIMHQQGRCCAARPAVGVVSLQQRNPSRVVHSRHAGRGPAPRLARHIDGEIHHVLARCGPQSAHPLERKRSVEHAQLGGGNHQAVFGPAASRIHRLECQTRDLGQPEIVEPSGSLGVVQSQHHVQTGHVRLRRERVQVLPPRGRSAGGAEVAKSDHLARRVVLVHGHEGIPWTGHVLGAHPGSNPILGARPRGNIGIELGALGSRAVRHRDLGATRPFLRLLGHQRRVRRIAPPATVEGILRRWRLLALEPAVGHQALSRRQAFFDFRRQESLFVNPAAVDLADQTVECISAQRHQVAAVPQEIRQRRPGRRREHWTGRDDHQIESRAIEDRRVRQRLGRHQRRFEPGLPKNRRDGLRIGRRSGSWQSGLAQDGRRVLNSGSTGTAFVHLRKRLRLRACHQGPVVEPSRALGLMESTADRDTIGLGMNRECVTSSLPVLRASKLSKVMERDKFAASVELVDRGIGIPRLVPDRTHVGGLHIHGHRQDRARPRSTYFLNSAPQRFQPQTTPRPDAGDDRRLV